VVEQLVEPTYNLETIPRCKDVISAVHHPPRTQNILCPSVPDLCKFQERTNEIERGREELSNAINKLANTSKNKPVK